jgi:ferritin-like metal-binding protein YciE
MREVFMSLDNLQALLLEQLQDIYYAEKQLVKALPKMAKAANTEELATAFTDHLEETKGQVARLERVFEAMGVAAKTKKCPAIEGLIEEASEMIEEEGEASVLDAGLIASGQRVEHYEIAAYSAARAFAEALGHADIVAMLDETLAEEHAADEKLGEICMDTVIPAALAAAGDDSEDEEEEEEPAAPAKGSKASKRKQGA